MQACTSVTTSWGNLPMKLRGCCFIFNCKMTPPQADTSGDVLLQQEGVGSHTGSPAHMCAQCSISTLSLSLSKCSLWPGKAGRCGKHGIKTLCSRQSTEQQTAQESSARRNIEPHNLRLVGSPVESSTRPRCLSISNSKQAWLIQVHRAVHTSDPQDRFGTAYMDSESNYIVNNYGWLMLIT